MNDEDFEKDVATILADEEKGGDEATKAALRLAIDAARNLRTIARAMGN